MAELTKDAKEVLSKRSIMKNMFRQSDDSSDDDSSNEGSVIGDNEPNEQLIELKSQSIESMVYNSILYDFQIHLQQEKKKGIAHQLWPAATFLSYYLEQNASTLIPQDTNILELGSGIGLCGLVCQKLQAKKVILTDLPVAIPLLHDNIHRNNSSVMETEFATSAMVLAWGNESDLVNVLSQFSPENQTLCIAADCVYWEDLFEPFYETVRSLVVDHHIDVILAHMKRWKRDERFFKMCRKHMQVIQLVEDIVMEPHEHTNEPRRVVKRIYRITSKATSIKK